MEVNTWITARLENGECTVTVHGAGTYTGGNGHERTASVGQQVDPAGVQAALEDVLKRHGQEIKEKAEEATIRAREVARSDSD